MGAPGRQTHVAIELWASAEGGTTVRVTESGFAALTMTDDPPVEVFAPLADPMRRRLLALLAGREVRYAARPERLASTARWIDATAAAWDRPSTRCADSPRTSD